MANEIQTFAAAGSTVYCVIRQYQTDMIYSATDEGWVTFNEDNWADYAVSLAAQSDNSNFFRADFPAVTANKCIVEVRIQTGESPSITDDTFHSASYVSWLGVDSGELLDPMDDLSYGISLREIADLLLAFIAGTTIVDTQDNTVIFNNFEGTQKAKITYGSGPAKRLTLELLE